MLYLSRVSYLFLLAGTLNPIKYSPAVLIHFAYPLPLITYKNKWGTANSSIPTGEENQPTKETSKGKNPSTTRKPTQTKEMANVEHPVKEIRDHTIESHRIPIIEVHPTKTASKMKHQEAQNQTKRVI